MPLWQLTPIDSKDPSWEASTYRGRVVVRARDEATARAKAENVFGAKTRFKPGSGIKAPPWKRPGLVAAEIIEDPRYRTEGPTEILYPSSTVVTAKGG
jgi:hypothetical protein